MTMADFASLEKIDAHVHVRYLGPEFVDQAKADGFKVLSVVTDCYDIPWQEEFITKQQTLHPGHFFYSTTFTVRTWDAPDWQDQVIAHLKEVFKKGPVAVKVWKNIGMEFQDKNGAFPMIDNPRFDPILEFIASEGKTLLAHMGEPRDCWLPLDAMVAQTNRRYYTRYPEYHMFLHPEYPSYEDQMAAFDHMVEKHPNLRVVGAHLASTEWSVIELAKRLDKFPNLTVDLSARMDDIQYQDQEEVEVFFLNYQDRILYGTDISIWEEDDPQEIAERLHQRWLNDWVYLATTGSATIRETDLTVQGLDLPVDVLEKIYRLNALRVYPGLSAS